MKNAFLLLAGIITLFLISSPADAQTLEETIAAADRESYLSMPEPPVGMSLSKEPIVVGDKFVGFRLVLSEEGVASKVMVSVDLVDRSEDKARRTACKGYVNGLIDGLKAVGLSGTGKLPDITTIDVKKPIDLDLEFANEKGDKYLVWKRMFFTSKGFDITVIALGQEDLDLLIDWAKKVRPVVAK